MKIGFIGLGIMGGHMAANLIDAGHELIIYNRTEAKAQPLLEKGAHWADSPASVAQSADVLITMLAHPQAVEATALSDDGFLPQLNGTWIDCSTVNPSFTREMAQHASTYNVRFIDAPVAGSKNQAANAELVFFVGSTEDDSQAIAPLFNVMGKRAVYMGEAGMGTSIKMVINMMLATSMAAFAEGVALGKGLGIPEETLLNVLIGGPVAAPFLTAKRSKMESGDFDAEFPLQWIHKDLHLATISAYETDTPATMADTAKELFRQALANFSQADFSALYAALNTD